jgi:uncharacterized protein YegP (UPF0339 family)
MPQGDRRLMSGYYQLIEGQDGAFVYVLRSGNHDRLFTSRLYWTRQAALDAAASMRLLSQQPAHYLRRDDRAAEPGLGAQWWFQVLDDARQPLGASEVYGTRAGREAAIAAVQRNAPAPRFRGLLLRPTVVDLAAGHLPPPRPTAAPPRG